MSTGAEILTVLVLHEMELKNSASYQSLTKAIDHISEKGNLFLYDNSMSGQMVEDNPVWNINYFNDPSNSGVGRAYNQALVIAKHLGSQWMLFTDQDTIFPQDLYRKYRQSIEVHPHCHAFAPNLIDKCGIISPFKRGLTSGKRLKEFVIGRKNLKEYHAINSGLLVKTDTFERVGGYEEKLRLDFSDFYFLKRLEQVSSQIVFIDAACLHSHSSTDTVTKKEALTRFTIYLESITLLSRQPSGIRFTWRAFLRAVKLSTRYRSTQFIRTYLSTQI